jgi:hypothetical protein
MPQDERIQQQVEEIDNSDRLICYATAGQLSWLQDKYSDASQARVAYAAGMGSSLANAGSVLSAALKDHLTSSQLLKLDGVIGALLTDMDGTGGLCSLALRLSAAHREATKDNSLITRVPTSWLGKILADPPGGDAGVLLQASALVAAFQAASKMPASRTKIQAIRNEYSQHIDDLVERLIYVGIGPPTARNYDAQNLLGMLSGYAFNEQMQRRLDSQLRESPLGFRVWRAVTKLVMLNGESSHSGPLKGWVRGLVQDAEDLRSSSIYPGRSLDLELAITVPASWPSPNADWVAEALLRRAKSAEATIRERGTAVMGLWQRALNGEQSELAAVRAELNELIDEFMDPDTRPDAAAGLQWIAVTLKDVMDREAIVCNTWPAVDAPWFRNVEAATRVIDRAFIPDHLRAGAKILFQQMLLQNAGVYRRHAIETVVTSCWAEPVIKALRHLLRVETESWLRIRALFALSFLQRPDLVENDLVEGCKTAYANLELDKRPTIQPPRTRITEMHAALFAVGDCFGVVSAEDIAGRVRKQLEAILTALAGEKDSDLYRVVRAVAYALIFTAQPRKGRRKDFSHDLLEKLQDHPDREVARLSSWALGFRFAPDGQIRPLLAASEGYTTGRG